MGVTRGEVAPLLQQTPASLSAIVFSSFPAPRPGSGRVKDTVGERSTSLLPACARARQAGPLQRFGF